MTTQVIVDGVALPLFQEEEKLNNDADDEKKKTNGLRRFLLFHSLWHALAIRHPHLELKKAQKTTPISTSQFLSRKRD